MTDISPWNKAIQEVTINSTSPWNEREPREFKFKVLPVTEYQLGNLLGLLKRNQDKNNGDWWYEWVDLAVQYMTYFAIPELVSNFGDKFTLESLQKGDWLK